MPVRIPDKISCDSLTQFEGEVKEFHEALSLVESEETWDRIEHALKKFTAIVKGGGYKFEKELVNALKTSSKGFASAMISERTRLATAALECLGAIAPRIGVKFEPLVGLYMPPLLRLSTRTNKVYVTRSQTTTALIIGYCQISSIIPHLLNICKESKIATGRLAGAEAALRALNKWDWTQRETRAKVTDIEEMLRHIGRDKDSNVRQASKKVFEAYEALFPERVKEFVAPLTPTMRKYLDIKASALDRTSASVNLSASASSVKPSTTNALRLDLRDEGFLATSQKISRAVPPTIPNSVNNHVTGSMLPPATLPLRVVNAHPSTSRRDPSPTSSEVVNEERQRVISNASSTFSVKSAPSIPCRPVIAHRQPIRLAVSQSNQNPTSVAIVPARRVRRVISIEPHPANQSDLFAAARKVNDGRAIRPDLKQVESKQTGGIAFPRMGGDSEGPVIERKGAQRVLKPGLPPSSGVVPKSNTEDGSKPVVTAPTKKETKQSIFRRGAPGAVDKSKSSVNDKQERPKDREGFIPRRGGLTQPTLSQLNKQRSRVVSVTAAKKPGMLSKPSTLKGNSRSKVAKTQGTGENPTSADASRSITPLPHLVPLPSSPEMATPPQKEDISDEPNNTVEPDAVNEVQRADDPGMLLEPDIPRDQGQPAGAGDSEGVVAQPNHEVRSASSTPIPQTPPFPTTDHADESHELDHIEFTRGEAYDPTGLPVKTPRKLESQSNENTADRTPLGKVILNQ